MNNLRACEVLRRLPCALSASSSFSKEILGVVVSLSVYDSLNSVHIYRFTVSSLAFFGRLTLFLLFRNF